jgi:RNA-directed DNA polymerase
MDYKIKKRKKGTRLISQPAKELKFLQRWVVDHIFNKFPIHKSVYSYKLGIGIRNNANLHKNKNFLLRADFVDFFHSILSIDIDLLIQRYQKLLDFHLSKDDIGIICKIVCKDGKLTIGAPSSPVISNTILYNFDKFWFEHCRKQQILYSRYADDLYFSTNYSNKLELIYKKLDEYLKQMKTPTLRLNKNKTVFTSKKHKRIVTGLVLTSKGKVSVGRAKKRHIKALIHQFINNIITEENLMYLRGYLAYVNAVEPVFLDRLKDKYGIDVITHILSPKPNNH